MATLAQPEVLETEIRKVLDGIPLPEGITLDHLEFRNNSIGDPAAFVVYSLVESPDYEEQAKEIQALRAAIRQCLWNFGLPLFPHAIFMPVQA